MSDTNTLGRPLPAGLVFTLLRSAGWSGRLVLLLRVMAVCSVGKGLYHWAAVCGFIGVEGGFEAHTQAWQATTVFFSVIDLVAAVGLWLAAPWGAVVWLTSTVTMIVVQLFFDEIFGSDVVVIAIGVFSILCYLVVALLAAREGHR